MDKHCSLETLDDANTYKCDSCGQKSQATKQLLIQEAPNVLTIQLKRFDVYGKKVEELIGKWGGRSEKARGREGEGERIARKKKERGNRF